MYTRHESIIFPLSAVSFSFLENWVRRYKKEDCMNAIVVTLVDSHFDSSSQPNSSLFVLLPCCSSSLFFSSLFRFSLCVYLSSLFWASLSRSSTLQIVSSVHHLTSSAIPHIFNIIERHQKKSSSSSGIKQTGTLAEQHPLCLLNCVGLCCADKQVPIGLIYTLIHDVRLSCCVE